MANLNRDFAITVAENTSPIAQAFSGTGSISGLGQLNPTGFSVSYGINTIPQARLDFGPSVFPILCDFERYRRHPLNVHVASPYGCLNFIGLIDGDPHTQMPGDLSLQLLLKSPFQVLNEINPSMPGYHAAGLDFFKRNDVIQRSSTKEGTKIAIKTSVANELNFDDSLPIVDGILMMLKTMLSSQKNWPQIAPNEQTAPNLPQTEAVLAACEQLSNRHIPLGLYLLDRITSAFASTTLTMSNFQVMDVALQYACQDRSSVFDALIGMLQQVCCNLVIANDRAFVVPDAGFLRITHPSYIPIGQTTTQPNVVMPVQYNQYSFSDSGYKDIVGVYLIADQGNLNAGVIPLDGLFIDTDANTAGVGGIIGMAMPPMVALSNLSNDMYSISAASQVAENKSNMDMLTHLASDITGTSPTEVANKEGILKLAAAKKTAIDAAQNKLDDEINASIDKRQQLANDYARLKYYQAKFGDRTGSFSMPFSPRFAPGAVGVLYAREPGIYIDFFVTGVTHSITISPETANATTQVNFTCGRAGVIGSSVLNAGLDRFELFDYTATKSFDFARSFVNNITS